MLFRRKPSKAIAELEAKVEELNASLVRKEQWRLQYKTRLLAQERDFPQAKRDLCNELIHWCRARYKSHLDWRAPVVPPEAADQEIRRILAAVEQVQENPGVALAGLTKKLGQEAEQDTIYRGLEASPD